MKRHIDIQGIHNLRDLGGYRTQDGSSIKWRKIFRAGLLGEFESSEIRKMKALQLQSICDFRTIAEQTNEPDQWCDLETLNRFPLPIGEGRVDKLDWLKVKSLGTEKNHYLYKANRSYVLREAHRYKAFFEILLNEDNYPLLYHCTAGKDRTGFATFLLLSALGVDRKTIIEDYLLTNQYMGEFAQRHLDKLSQKLEIDTDNIKSIFQAKRIYLEGALDAIETEYQTVENYLTTALNIGEPEIKQLKRILLEE